MYDVDKLDNYWKQYEERMKRLSANRIANGWKPGMPTYGREVVLECGQHRIFVGWGITDEEARRPCCCCTGSCPTR